MQIITTLVNELDSEENPYELLTEKLKYYDAEESITRFIEIYDEGKSHDQLMRLSNNQRDFFIEGVKLYKSKVTDIDIRDEEVPDKKAVDEKTYKKLYEKTLKFRREDYIRVAKANGLRTVRDVSWYYLKCDVYQLLGCVRFYMHDILKRVI